MRRRSRLAIVDDDDEPLRVTTKPVKLRGSVRLSRPRGGRDFGALLGVPWWLWVLGAAGTVTVVAIILTRKKEINSMLSKAVDLAQENAFAAVLPKGVASYARELITSAQRYGVSPWALAGIMYRESGGGFASGYKPQGSSRGTGDWAPRAPSHTYFRYANPATGLPPDGLGWGRGLMQLDYGVHNAWVLANDWGNPQVNIDKAASILADNQRYFSNSPGAPVTVQSWRLNGLTDANGRTIVNGWGNKYGLRSTGPFADPRPLSGPALLDAAMAAYNAGAGGVLQALAAGLPASAATAGNDYSDWIATRAEGWAQGFA